MGIILIIAGGVLGWWAVNVHRRPEAQRPIISTGPLGGLVLLLATIAGPALVIWGLVSLFT